MAKYGSCVCELAGLRTDLLTGGVEMTLRVPKDCMSSVRRIAQNAQGKKLSVEISDYRKKRGLDANSYMWTLCSKIADKLGITKEEVYRQHILEIAEYEPLPIKNEAVGKFIEAWQSKGIAWMVDVVDDSKIPGYKLVYAYYGSSQYDTAQMSRLIDNIVQDAKALDIETLTPAEIARMKAAWA